MTALTPLGFPYPEPTDRATDGWDAIHDLAVALDSAIAARPTATTVNGQVAGEASARAAADTALGNRATALEATVNADSGWIALRDGIELATGWVAYGGGFATPAYRKLRGVVYLSGMVKASGVPEHDTKIATLPAGYRPRGLSIFIGGGQLSPEGLTDLGIRVEISAAGVITPTVQATAGSGAVAWISLSPISFPADN